MITNALKTIVGSGIRAGALGPAIASFVRNHGGKVTIIGISPMLTQWQRILGDVEIDFVTPMAWMRRGDQSTADFILVDEMHEVTLSMIMASLEASSSEAWVLNSRLPINIAPRPATAKFLSGVKFISGSPHGQTH